MADNIIKSQVDGYDIYINGQTGESFTSIRGYARMSGKGVMTIQNRLDKVYGKLNQNAPKSSNVGGPMVDGGYIAVVDPRGVLQQIRAVSEDLICKWIPKDNPTIATQLLKLGVRSYHHKIAGYKHESTLYPKFQAIDRDDHLIKSLPDPFTIAEYLAHFQIGRRSIKFETLTGRVGSAYRTLTDNRTRYKRCTITGNRVRAYEKQYQWLVNKELTEL